MNRLGRFHARLCVRLGDSFWGLPFAMIFAPLSYNGVRWLAEAQERYA